MDRTVTDRRARAIGATPRAVVADYGRESRAFPDGERRGAGFNPPMTPITRIRRRHALHICAACGGDYANPAAWEQPDPLTWVVSLRCGACGHERDVTVGKGTARRFNRALDRGYNAIERAAERLERERMAGWVEAFGAALQRDLIDAADFAR